MQPWSASRGRQRAPSWPRPATIAFVFGVGCGVVLASWWALLGAGAVGDSSLRLANDERLQGISSPGGLEIPRPRGKHNASRTLLREPLHWVGRPTQVQPRRFRFDERCEEWTYRQGGDGDWAYWPASARSAGARRVPTWTGTPARGAATPEGGAGPRAAVVILARRKNLFQLRHALWRVDAYLNRPGSGRAYPVFVFHDDLSQRNMSSLRSGLRTRLQFFEVSMCIPRLLGDDAVPRYVLDSPINCEWPLPFLRMGVTPGDRQAPWTARPCSMPSRGRPLTQCCAPSPVPHLSPTTGTRAHVPCAMCHAWAWAAMVHLSCAVLRRQTGT